MIIGLLAVLLPGPALAQVQAQIGLDTAPVSGCRRLLVRDPQKSGTDKNVTVGCLKNGDLELRGIEAQIGRVTITNSLDLGQGSTMSAPLARSTWSHSAPTYDLASNLLGVSNFYHAGDVTIPAGKQYNVIRMDGIFRGGDKAKGINFDFDVYGSDDAYGVIGLLNNYGPGPSKAIYGRSVAKSGSTGIVVGGVSGVTVDTGATPSAAYGHQISMAGTGSAGVANFGHTALRINTDNNILGINNGVIVLDEGIFSDNRVGYSDAFIRAVNGTVGTDGTQTQAAGAFLRWQDVGGQFLFEVDKDGLLFQRDKTGKQLFATDAGGNVLMGSTNVSQRRLQLYTSATEYYLQGVDSGNYLRVRDNTIGKDLMRLSGISGDMAIASGLYPFTTTAQPIGSSVLRFTDVFGNEVPAVTIVTSGASYVIGTNDKVVVVRKSSGSATAVTLPASPATGQTIIIKDGKGDAAVNPITITALAGTIDGATSSVISANRGVARLTYDGTEWVAL
ncbi:hypothetical protein [Sphingobium sp. B2]|uniref:hypothetical protein n=1 Tax=Sphingobium sp. B2 TaxID=2583228 RepID=UPI0011A72858|nr:hypothetical protein [Sphingobium sp. B2]